jgi:periplasmic protein CpxP/Spy
MTMNTMMTSSPAGPRSMWNSRGMGKLLLVLAVAVAGSFALSAWAQPAGQQHRMGGEGAHSRMHGGPEGGGMWANPKRMDRLLDSVKATDAQRAQIKQIMQAAAADMATQRDAGRSLHERALAVFTAPTVDANAAEQVRQQMLAQHDQGSRRMMVAMLDVSRVLTPEQRAQMAERMQQHRHGRHGERAAPKQP